MSLSDKMKSIKTGIQRTLLLAFLVISFSLFLWSFTITPMPIVKCNDATIKEAVKTSEDISVLLCLMLMAIGIIQLFVMSVVEERCHKKNKILYTIGHSFLVPFRPFFINIIGYFATFASVQIASRYLGFVAPDFIAACRPVNLTSLCNKTATHFVMVNCTTPRLSWIASAYAFPSVYSTMIAFNMCFHALHIGYRIRSRLINYISRLIAFSITCAIGCLQIYLNQANQSAVWVGGFIGVSCAGFSFIILLWLEKEDKSQLPRFWDDPPPKNCGRNVTTVDPLTSPAATPSSFTYLGDNNPPPPVHPPPYRSIYPAVPTDPKY